jgi:hypothetical protein
MKLMNKNSPGALCLALVLAVCVLSSPAVRAGADTADIPRPLGKALSIYKKGGIEGFIRTLVSGGPLEGNQELHMQALVLEKIEKYYGAYQSFQVLHVTRLSGSTRLIYFLMNYEKGPVFGKLTAYKNGDRETITSFRFHTKPDKIFPDALLVGP